MKNLYDKEYFEDGIAVGVSLYTNYQWMPELTIPMCCELKERLPLRKGQKILDFGCAKGFMVKAFCLLGLDAYGYDLSEYAVSQAPSDVRDKVFNEVPNLDFDWVIAKDVLEHVPYNEIHGILEDMPGQQLFIVVPLGREGRFNVPAYELDTTHIIKEPLEWWRDKIERAGFLVNYADYFFGNIKANWAKYKYGNGFFIAERK